jgi:hypothetical protein
MVAEGELIRQDNIVSVLNLSTVDDHPGPLKFIGKVSLLQLTRMLLHARQQGRSLLNQAWTLVGDLRPFSHDGIDGYLASDVAYGQSIVKGIQLIRIPDDITASPRAVLCPFGCKVDADNHRWLCRQEYYIAFSVLG